MALNLGNDDTMIRIINLVDDFLGVSACVCAGSEGAETGHGDCERNAIIVRVVYTRYRRYAKPTQNILSTTRTHSSASTLCLRI